MSVQFNAVAVYRLDAPVLNLLPAGTTLCVDARGNWYRHISPITDEGLTLKDLQEVYPATKKGTRLYRDYWRHLSWHSTAPVRVALDKAPKTLISAKIG